MEKILSIFIKYGSLSTTLILAVLLGASRASANSGKPVDAPAALNEPHYIYQIYLPLVYKGQAIPEGGMGATMEYVSDPGLNLAKQAGMQFARHTTLFWDKIEPVRTVPPTYHWETVEEDQILLAAQHGVSLIAIVQFIPTWAQKISGVSCGPVAEKSLDAFAQFMQAAVQRYSTEPYNVKFWELGNEPDIDPKYVAPDSSFGCWGNENDPYYGGEYYGHMLQRVYPAIKSSDPRAKVLLGGLAMTRDPMNPTDDGASNPGNFFEGVLRGGGGPYFDILNFHGYIYYNGPGRLLSEEANNLAWAARGGLVIGKINLLREIMGKYGISKPIFQTEGALLCRENNPICNPAGDDFFEEQANYVVWLTVRNLALDVKATLWFQLDNWSWRYSSLVDYALDPRPSYFAYQFLTQELINSQYTQTVDQFSDLQGYEFMSAGKRIWVLWSKDEQVHTINLPGKSLHIFDKYGKEIFPEGDTLSVQYPIYVEFGL